MHIEYTDSVSGCSPQLDTITKYVAGPAEQSESRERRRIGRYRLQDRIRSILRGHVDGRGRPFRTIFCLRCLLSGQEYGELLRCAERLLGRFGKVVVCGSVWLCPVCSSVVADRRRQEVAVAVSGQVDAGGQVVMVTRTGGHTAKDPLVMCRDRFLNAERKMSQARSYRALLDRIGCEHTIRVLEVTYSASSGWHVHSHTLLFLRVPVSDVQSLQGALFDQWRRAADRVRMQVSERAFKLQASFGAVEDYISKYGKDPEGRPWGVEDEITQGHLKRGRGAQSLMPFDLAASDDPELQARFLEYAQAFVGRKRLQFSDGLRERFGLEEVDDLAAAAEPLGEWELFREFHADELRAASYTGLRGEWLRYVGVGDVDAERVFITTLVQRYRFLMQSEVRDVAGEKRWRARILERMGRELPEMPAAPLFDGELDVGF